MAVAHSKRPLTLRSVWVDADPHHIIAVFDHAGGETLVRLSIATIRLVNTRYGFDFHGSATAFLERHLDIFHDYLLWRFREAGDGAREIRIEADEFAAFLDEHRIKL